MRTSEQITELATAVSKAATKFPKIERRCTATVYPKDKDKKPYSYDYADLDDVLSAVRSPLAENGVILSHDAKLIREPLCLEVTARLEHSSGQWKESDPLPMPLEGTMSVTQQIGSAYTYGRRYTSQAILGISTEADDDGNVAGDQEAETGRRQRQPKPPCPKCGKPEFVYEDRQKGGWFCWKTKGGCGHNWLPVDEQPPANVSEAKQIADEHGMTTADKLPAKQHTPTFQLFKDRLAKFDAAAPDSSKKLTAAEDFIYKEWSGRKAITDAEKQELDFMVAEIQKEIDGHKQLHKEAAGAAA